jgi:hypothetical protein
MAAATVREPEVPAGRRLYYGWIVLLVAALAMVGTLPGPFRRRKPDAVRWLLP